MKVSAGFAAVAAASALGASAWPWGEQIKHIVQFGDSYTDSTFYIVTNGTTWGQYLASYARLSLNNFAISGATCNNASTPRFYPDVAHNELGAYYNFTQGKAAVLPPFFDLHPNRSTTFRADETLYSLWIGTNDVGVGELITGQAAPGVSIVNTSQCAVDWISTLYKSGARKFLFQNMLPLEKTILYSADSYPNKYWTAPRNTVEWNIFMKELVASGNALTRLMIEALAPKLKGATIGYFDSYAFFNDMYNHPAMYLNGTAPLNVTGAVASCVHKTNESTSDLGTCTWAHGSDKDSFLWADELHPSEQADRRLAQQLFDIYAGRSSKYITFYGEKL